MDKIDFVITWVDGSDKEWLKEKLKCQGNDFDESNLLNSINRYRDMETLKYWFRAVEKYAPWVNKIFFVTWGHLPNWLNLNNPKLRIVNHKDYIPKAYLPTFNSNVIEMNFHRIDELSECFVNFNDDMFVTRKIKPEIFFKKGFPCGSAILKPIIPSTVHQHTTLNNIIVLNRNFDIKKSIRNNFFKFFNYRYGKHLIESAVLSCHQKVCGFREAHSAVPLLKSTMEEVWDKEFEALDNASKNQFRCGTDISDWLIEKWNFMSGKFYPINPNKNRKYELTNNNQRIVDAIINKKYNVLCINDGILDYDFEKAKSEIIQAFEKVLPEKSSFEL